MADRFSLKIMANHRCLLKNVWNRFYAISRSTATNNSAQNGDDVETCFKRLGDLSFNDTQEAFKSKSNFDLWRALIVLNLCSYETLVQHNLTLMNTTKKIFGQRIFETLMRWSFYGHFVAGANEKDIRPSINRLRAFGVKSILDYSVEADVDTVEKSMEIEDIGGIVDRRVGVISARTYTYEGEPECDRNMEIFRNCISAVTDYTGGTGFSVIKMTALGRPQLLLRLSDVIVKYQNFFKLLTRSDLNNLTECKLSEEQFAKRLDELGLKTDSKELKDWFRECDHNGDGQLDIYEWSRLLDQKFKLAKMFKIVNLRTGKVESLIPDLSELEEAQYRNLIRRIDILAEFAQEKNVRMMVDAEQTYLQPAISRLTVELMRKYNKKKPVIFNTYQAYLKKTLCNVKIDLQIARRDDLYFGAKLVRGAYMLQERERAGAMHYEDPVNPDYDATTVMYDSVFKEIIEEVKKRPMGKVAVMCATHNEDTIRHVLNIMRSNGIGPQQHVCCFGQLYGMCDQVSFPLGQAGFSVYKYVPYGPVEGVMPYMSRRVQENSGSGGMLAKSSRERKMLRQELKRRYKKLQFFYNPAKYASYPEYL
uniref:Proline dehydrogenase n=1 Tax=Romanomermis culicivorax TaxID=13658 RepID=A0A915KZZ2_ROMCU